LPKVVLVQLWVTVYEVPWVFDGRKLAPVFPLDGSQSQRFVEQGPEG
jgi:hypothetical protein